MSVEVTSVKKMRCAGLSGRHNRWSPCNCFWCCLRAQQGRDWRPASGHALFNEVMLSADRSLIRLSLKIVSYRTETIDYHVRNISQGCDDNVGIGGKSRHDFLRPLPQFEEKASEWRTSTETKPTYRASGADCWFQPIPMGLESTRKCVTQL